MPTERDPAMTAFVKTVQEQHAATDALYEKYMRSNPDSKIPQPLINAGARFIKVLFQSKAAFEDAWEKNTYSHDDPDLLNWLDKGGNYGVVSHNGIGTIDIDDLTIFEGLGLKIPDTFTDAREDKRFHVFFKCDDLPEDRIATKIKTKWGDIRFPGHNSYVVGTGSIAPNKQGQLKPYILRNASEVNNISWFELHEIVNKQETPASTSNEIEILDSEPKKKPPYVMDDGVKKNHYTIISYVGKEMATNVPLEAIHAACQTMNKDGYFDRTRTPEELTKEVDSAIAHADRKQRAKKQDKKKKESERTIILPGGVITQEMKDILDRHHPNVAIAHCLNKRIGTDAPEGGSVRWNTDQQAWFVWDGGCWQKEPDGLSIVKHSEEFLFKAMEDAARSKNETFLKRLLSCQGIGNIRGAMGFLQGMTAVKDDVFDADDNLFNVSNGTLDLTTGKLLPFEKSNFITRQGKVSFDSSAVCPMWEAHMKLVIPDDRTRLSFQGYMGYTLIAGNGENTALFLYGGGKNGKTETVLTIGEINGTYTLNAQAASFYVRKYDDTPRPDIARLKGPRFVTIPEGTQGKIIDEGLLKQLTGGDVVTARFLYGREFDFIPKAKLIFFTNHLPKIQGRDPGIWRRIFPIPFEQSIPKEKRIRDYHKILIEKEGPGILNWLLIGLMEYRENGLIVSDAIKAAKGTYKAREDVLAEFMDKYVITDSKDDVIPRADLYESYKLWAGGDQTNKMFQKNKFNTLIEERVGAVVQRNGVWYWTGIRVLAGNEVGSQRTIEAEW